MEKQRKEQRKKERAELQRQQQQQAMADLENAEDERVADDIVATTASPDGVVAVHQEEPPARVAHVQTHDVSHGEAVCFFYFYHFY